MSKVLVTKEKLDTLANMVAAKSGEELPLTIDDMVEAVYSIPTDMEAFTDTVVTLPNGADHHIITGVNLAGDTVTAQHLELGYTAHDAQGNPITGTLIPGSGNYSTASLTLTISAVSGNYNSVGVYFANIRRFSNMTYTSSLAYQVPNGLPFGYEVILYGDGALIAFMETVTTVSMTGDITQVDTGTYLMGGDATLNVSF